ncbi:hypothetical protein BJ973_002601 [Actinoplanes tereljensis]|uniref:Uncharacterized protein n=1 Tax=Paractinoplanes tereljensis TaxID=571912 RepID=A0A919NR38_9ACTN|nr:hypothetical protein [Actinoplanes tereljensis]GIF22277.1 hypothetical protein Ate02nite_50070 [Actinoplanes tereljensis]
MSNPGNIYFDFIEQELTAERARMSSLDSRSASIVASSVTLAGLIGIGGALASPGVIRQNVVSSILLTCAIGAFVCASLLGILSGRRRLLKAISDETLKDMISDQHWTDSEELAQRAVAFVKVQTICSIRASNANRGKILTAALIAQIAALALVASYASARILL